jgi:hypothetical protein
MLSLDHSERQSSRGVSLLDDTIVPSSLVLPMRLGCEVFDSESLVELEARLAR